MKLFNRISVPTIGFQFTVLLSIFALIPTIFICILVYRINDGQSSALSLQTAESAVTEAANNIGAIIQSAENTASVLSKDSNLQMAHVGFSGEISLSTAIDYYIRLNKLFTYLNLNSSFHSIRVFLPDYYPITTEGYSILSMSELITEQLPEDLQTAKQGYGWFGPYELIRISDRETVITYYHSLFSYEQLSSNNSLICIDISVDKLKEVFNKNASVEAIYMLSDSTNDVLFVNQSNIDINSFKKFIEEESHDLSHIIEIPNLGSYFYKQVPVGNSGWKINGFVPLHQFQKDYTIIFYVICVFIGCMCVIPVISYQIVNVLVKGISVLTENCERVKRGNYQLIPEDGTTKEIRLLQSTHNSMVEKIDKLIHDVYEVSLAKQEAEMEFLYAQIKPHFLYNTLESAKWLAFKEGAPRVADFIEQLSKYFSLTLNKGNDWISLNQELELIQTYIHIMNLRFANRIRYRTTIEGDAGNFPILKSILQPIVENAIIHGIHEKEEFTGTIEITASLSEDDNIVIAVEDDGNGIDQETIDRLNQNEPLGYGITNVRKRLQLFYKDNFSLRFSKNCKNGTTVIIILPYKNDS